MEGSMAPFPFLVILLVCYLVVAIPFGLLLTRLAGAGDIRKTGSGNAAFPVHLRHNGTTIQSEQAEFADNERFRKIAFTITPDQIGSQLYEVVIEPEGDQDSSNNRKELLIEVTDAKQRVLYLEGVPRWEFKFLKRALLAEKSYQLSAFVQGGDGAFINFDEQSGLAGGALPTLDDRYGVSVAKIVEKVRGLL